MIVVVWKGSLIHAWRIESSFVQNPKEHKMLLQQLLLSVYLSMSLCVSDDVCKIWVYMLWNPSAQNPMRPCYHGLKTNLGFQFTWGSIGREVPRYVSRFIKFQKINKYRVGVEIYCSRCFLYYFLSVLVSWIVPLVRPLCELLEHIRELMTQIQVKCVLSRDIPIYKYDPYIPNETATSTPPDQKFLQSLTMVQTFKTWSHKNPRCTIRKSPIFSSYVL